MFIKQKIVHDNYIGQSPEMGKTEVRLSVN